jgi:Fic family protein
MKWKRGVASGMFLGTIKYLAEEEKTRLTIDLISNEPVTTSEIEGEILNRESVQSSIRRNFGLETDNRKVPHAEQGIAARPAIVRETIVLLARDADAWPERI